MASRGRAGDEHGFTLVEAIVALGLAVVLLLVSGTQIVRGWRAAVLARQQDAASVVLLQQIEAARGLPYASLLTRTPVGADPRVVGNADGTWSAQLGRTGGTTEPLVVGAGGLAPAAVQQDGTTFTITPYVTMPSGCSCRRFTARATWSAQGQTQSRTAEQWASTLITNVPQATTTLCNLWLRNGGRTVAASSGSTLVVPIVLVNSGNRGGWTVTARATSSSGAPLTWPFSWYLDSNADGVWSQSTETTQLDAATAGTAATGRMESGQGLSALAVSTPSGTSGSVAQVRFTATSTSDATVTCALTVPVAL